jgi:hypothetical protein
MSRKVPSFGQLIGYIDRDEGQEQWRIRHNVFARDPARIRDEFERNGDLLQRRKNGVYLYHEIISITRAEGLSAEEQKRRLRDIAESYIAARCPDNMVFGGLHQDKDHSFHYHLMISANRAGEAKRLRLSKGQFREIQVQLERHVLQTMPELEQKVAIDKRAEHRKTRGEAELERRTGKTPKKDQVRARVLEALESAQDRDSLMDALGRNDLELYVRGKTLGVTDHETGKNHRLKTLDLELADRVEAMMLEQSASRENTGPAGEKEKAPYREAEAQGQAAEPDAEREAGKDGPESGNARYVNNDSSADLKRDPTSQPNPEPEQAPPERSERQQAWREEIDQRRAQGRGDPGREDDEPER